MAINYNFMHHILIEFTPNWKHKTNDEQPRCFKIDKTE